MELNSENTDSCQEFITKMLKKRLDWEPTHFEYIKNHAEIPDLLNQYKKLLQNDYNKRNLYDLTFNLESTLMFESMLSTLYSTLIHLQKELT